MNSLADCLVPEHAAAIIIAGTTRNSLTAGTSAPQPRQVRKHIVREGESFTLGGVDVRAINRNDNADERRIAPEETQAVVQQPRFAHGLARQHAAVHGIPIQDDGAVAVLADEKAPGMTLDAAGLNDRDRRNVERFPPVPGRQCKGE